jgi:hypothetical protein
MAPREGPLPDQPQQSAGPAFDDSSEENAQPEWFANPHRTNHPVNPINSGGGSNRNNRNNDDDNHHDGSYSNPYRNYDDNDENDEPSLYDDNRHEQQAQHQPLRPLQQRGLNSLQPLAVGGSAMARAQARHGALRQARHRVLAQHMLDSFTIPSDGNCM